MKRLPYLFLFLLLLAGLESCQPVEAPSENNLLAGAASAAVSPPAGTYIAGDKQNRTFTGVHDDLYAKAVVIDDGQNAMAILTIDCIGLMHTDLLSIRKKVAALSDFPAANIVVSSTHTHSGPDVVGIWGPDLQHTGVDSAYMEFLTTTAAEQVVAADRNKVPVQIRTGESTYGLGWVENICNEEIDRSVSVIQFTDKDSNPVASLTNFACHPTFMDATYTEVSADYVAGFYQALDSAWGGENLFLQGAIGGWVQPTSERGNILLALEKGKGLAKVTIQALENAEAESETSVEFRSQSLVLPVTNEGWKQLSAIGTIPRKIRDSVETEVAWFRIGPAEFATHPGETAPWFGLETKKLMQGTPKFVLGLSQDALGYILKPTFFQHDTIPHAPYLTRMSVGPETGPIIMETLQPLIRDKRSVASGE